MNDSPENVSYSQGIEGYGYSIIYDIRRIKSFLLAAKTKNKKTLQTSLEGWYVYGWLTILVICNVSIKYIKCVYADYMLIYKLHTFPELIQ